MNDRYSQYLCCWEWMWRETCEWDGEGSLGDANTQNQAISPPNDSKLQTTNIRGLDMERQRAD